MNFFFALVLAGGRGLGTFKSGLKGGVHLCDSVKDVSNFAQQSTLAHVGTLGAFRLIFCCAVLGQTLVTKQTGSQGRVVNTVRVVVKKSKIFQFLFA